MPVERRPVPRHTAEDSIVPGVLSCMQSADQLDGPGFAGDAVARWQQHNSILREERRIVRDRSLLAGGLGAGAKERHEMRLMSLARSGVTMRRRWSYCGVIGRTSGCTCIGATDGRISATPRSSWSSWRKLWERAQLAALTKRVTEEVQVSETLPRERVQGLFAQRGCGAQSARRCSSPGCAWSVQTRRAQPS